jgi:cobalt-precorrin 5A hydrolase
LSTGIITLSKEGLIIARALAKGLPGAVLYVHRSVLMECEEATHFEQIIDLTRQLFHLHRGLVYIAPCGMAVRAVAPCLDRKTTDPAVVAVDAGGRFAVSLLSGHEGGANQLAVTVANIIGAEPVISTTTEALKTVIVGVGCRRNITKDEVVRAIISCLEESAILLSEVRMIATADIKKDETGLIEAANELNVPLMFVSSKRIRTFGGVFETSSFIQEKVGLPAVAEPCCMLAGRNTQLIVRKIKCNKVTIAIARENCLWSV